MDNTMCSRSCALTLLIHSGLTLRIRGTLTPRRSLTYLPLHGKGLLFQLYQEATSRAEPSTSNISHCLLANSSGVGGRGGCTLISQQIDNIHTTHMLGKVLGLPYQSAGKKISQIPQGSLISK